MSAAVRTDSSPDAAETSRLSIAARRRSHRTAARAGRTGSWRCDACDAGGHARTASHLIRLPPVAVIPLPAAIPAHREHGGGRGVPRPPRARREPAWQHGSMAPRRVRRMASWRRTQVRRRRLADTASRASGVCARVWAWVWAWAWAWAWACERGRSSGPEVLVAVALGRIVGEARAPRGISDAAERRDADRRGRRLFLQHQGPADAVHGACAHSEACPHGG